MSPARRETQGPLERNARALLRDASRSMRDLERRMAPAVAAAAETIIASLGSGGTVYFCGNGGSAADAQHLAAELAGRYLMDRPSLAATALSTNTSSLTAIGNDFGFDQVFSRQLEGVGTPGDVLVAITTSGNSPNVLAAVETARRRGMAVIGMTGANGRRLIERCDVALVSPSHSTPHIQEGHIVMGHAFCHLVERGMFPARDASRAPSRKLRSPAARTRRGRGQRVARNARPGVSRESRSSGRSSARNAKPGVGKGRSGRSSVRSSDGRGRSRGRG